MALNGAGITSAIAALSISGVTIKDVASIPQNVYDRDCPLLFPQPGSWMEGGQALSENNTTFGTPSTRYWTSSHKLNYVYLHSEIGSGRGVADVYTDAVANVEAILTALITLDVSGVDVESVSNGSIGNITAPSGKRFTGCEISVSVRQRINA